jgi:two-component system, cell cycle sensor histidine kinase and response regulator CckA
LGLVFFALLGLSFYLASQLTRSLTRPISLLSGTVRQIAEHGDFRLRAPKVSSDDIGLLADHFNRMLDVLEEQDAHLRESEQRFRSLVEEEGSLPIFGFDRNRQTIFWNNACDRLFGYSREEVIGHPLENFIVPPSLRERYLRTIVPLLEQGKVHPANEIDLMRKDGSIVPIYYSQVQVRNRYGNLEWYSVIVDLTERRRAAAEKQRLESQIQQSQKMEAIGQLAGGVAHDFNNLLQAINGYAEIVLDEIPEGSTGRTEIQEIARAGQRAARLVGQLLTFSRRQILQPENLNMNRVVDEFLKLLNRVIGEHIQIDFSPGRPIGTVRADRVQMEQVLMNLCLNARDAMPKGGLLKIETANVAVDEEFHRTHPWAPPGQYVQISVSDTGCGMDADTRERIFEPFFTTKGLGKGTGLGLAMVYGIIKQHEGAIQVYSEPGMGSTFTVFLPAKGQAESGPAIKREISVRGGSETLLLAEDDETVRTLAQKILRGAGYKVLIAADGSEALRVFRQHAAEIDLVMLDMIMPQLSGRAVSEEIRKDYPQLPVLFASGYSADILQSNIRLEEDITLIQKPYSPKELLHRIRDLLDQS